MSRSQAANSVAKSSGDEWFTPRALIELLGPFDLDPATADDRPWDTATQHITVAGLRTPWRGFVWLNPPFSNIGPWLQKLSEHPEGGLALVPASVGAKYWRRFVYPCATAIAFLPGRLRFCNALGFPRDSAAFYCALIAYGAEAHARCKRAPDTKIWVLKNDSL